MKRRALAALAVVLLAAPAFAQPRTYPIPPSNGPLNLRPNCFASMVGQRFVVVDAASVTNCTTAGSTGTPADCTCNGSTWVDTVSWLGATGGGGGGLTCEEVDGSPTGVASKLQFDQADGLHLTNPTGSTFRLDLSGVPLSVLAPATASRCARFDASGVLVAASGDCPTGGSGGGTGTVTSVDATVPTWLAVAGVPITTSGIIAITAAGGQTANRVLATPNGSAGAVALRALASGDMPAYTGDVTSAAGGTVNTLANIPTATPLAGYLLATNVAAPATPAAGKTGIYVDSTDKRLHDINDAGAIGTTIVPGIFTSGSHTFTTGFSSAGQMNGRQPAIADLAVGMSANLYAILADANGTGTAVFGTSPTIATPTLSLTSSTTPTPTATGRIEWDSDDKCLVVGDGAAAQRFCSNADFVRLTRNAAQSIPDNTSTAITWEVEVNDDGGYHSLVSNTERITIPTGKAGLFAIFCGIQYAPSTLGWRAGEIRQNGVNYVARVRQNALSDSLMQTNVQVAHYQILADGDYLECIAQQTSGAALNIGNPTTSSFMVVRLNGSGTGAPAVPYVRLTKSATQSLTTATATAVTWDGETEDASALHDTSTNTARITFNRAGIWAYSCALGYATNSTGARLAIIRLNGTGSTTTTNIGQSTDHPTAGQGGASPSISGRYRFAVNDYVECVGYQDSTTTLNVLATGTSAVIGNSYFEATYVGP